MALRPPSANAMVSSHPTPRMTCDGTAFKSFTIDNPELNAFELSSPTPSRSSSETDEMRCKRAHAALTTGFYSVGVGAPSTVAPATTTSRSPSLRFLEHLIMEITIVSGSTNSRMTKQYSMKVHHTKTKASWRHCHSFDDYLALQRRLLAHMDQGHFCMAECPWIYTFLRRSFPKPPARFSFGLLRTDKAAEERRLGLVRTLAALQSVLLNPHNHSCKFLTNGVATELVAFLYGETIDQVNRKAAAAPSPIIVHPWETTSPLANAVRDFSTSLDEGDVGQLSDESSKETTSSSCHEENDVCCAVCAIHDQHSEDVVLADWHAHATQPAKRTRTDSVSDTVLLSQLAATPTDSWPETPRTPRSPPPPLFPENAVLSPRRHYHVREAQRPSKRFSLGASTVGLLNSFRQRVLTMTPTQGPYVA